MAETIALRTAFSEVQGTRFAKSKCRDRSLLISDAIDIAPSIIG